MRAATPGGRGACRSAPTAATRTPTARLLLAVRHRAAAGRAGRRRSAGRVDRHDLAVGRSSIERSGEDGGELNAAEQAAVDALPAGNALLVVQRGPRRRQPVPARHRRRHRRAAPRQRDLPRRRDRLPPAREFRRAEGGFTVADVGQPQRHLRQPRPHRRRQSCQGRRRGADRQVPPGVLRRATLDAGGRAVTPAARPRGRAGGLGPPRRAEHRRGPRPSCARTSRTSRSPRSASSRPRAWSSRERTPSGYRKFCHDDVEPAALRAAAQRDHYLPLKVIGEHLDAIDRGLEPPPTEPGRPDVPTAVAASGTTGCRRRVLRRRRRAGCGSRATSCSSRRGSTEELLAPARGVRAGDGRARRPATTTPTRCDRHDRPRAGRARVRAAAPAGVQDRRRPRGRPGRAGRRPTSAAATPPPRPRAEETVTRSAALSVRLHATLVKAGLPRLR